MSFYDAFWSTVPRKLGSVIGGVTLVSGAIAAIPPAWSVVEPMALATRTYVREYTDTRYQVAADSGKLTRQLVIDLMAQSNRVEQRKTQADIYRQEEKVRTNPTVDDRLQLDKLREELEIVKGEAEKLKKLRDTQ